MKFTYNWLKEFVDLKIKPDKLAARLTMSGLEVKSVEEKEGDFIFEAEVTSNRPDWLSVAGIAREVVALTGKKIKNRATHLKIKKLQGKVNFRIEIENKKDCPLYNATIIRNLNIGSSPRWLRQRLELIGCRSINSVVDITNYCMYTWGQPLHAFDLDKIVNQFASSPVRQLNVIIRRAKKGEEIITIDGIKKILDEEILIIASETGKPANRQTGKPVALAGIMGGKDTEVNERSKDILLEAAIFDPLVVRVGRRKLGIQSDASYRFERSVDICSTEQVASYATRLILEIAGGECVLIKSSNPVAVRKRAVIFDVGSVNKLLGIDNIPVGASQRYLQALGFCVKKKSKGRFAIGIPSFRPDIQEEIDVIEEIARIHGYEKIPTTFASVIPQEKGLGARDLVSHVKNILVGLGLQEAVTYSLVSKELLKGFEAFGWGVEVLNPLSKEQEILRPTLIPSLLRCVATNLNQKKEYIAIFEIANGFAGVSDKEEPSEELRLAVAMCGQRSQWFTASHIKDEISFLHLKGIVETLTQRLGVSSCSFVPSNISGQFDALINNRKIGVLAKIERAVLEKIEIKNKDVYVCELVLDKVISTAKLPKRYIPISKFPYIQRDISLVLREEIALSQILEIIRLKGGGFLRETEAIDYYKGKQVESGFKGVTISCRYASNQRTLTEAEVNPVHTTIIKNLEERLGAKIR